MKNFLKTAAHQHKDPQVRLGFVNDLEADSADAQEMLTGLARSDNDLQVRTAAIGKLNELHPLRELLDANGDDADAVAEAAEARLLHRLHEGAVSDIAVRGLLSSHAARLAVPIASSAGIAEQREIALTAIEEESSLVMVVQQSRFHDTRLAAAMRLSQHDALRTALSAVRSKDKVVAKQLQQRLDAEAAAEAALIAKSHAISTTLKTVQSLNEGVWSPQHGGRLQAAKERWASFDSADVAEYQSDFDAAMSAAQSKYDQYSAAQAAADTSSSQQTVAQADGAASSASINGDRAESSISQKDDASSESAVAPETADRVVEKVDDPALVPVLAKLEPCSITTLPKELEALQELIAADEQLSQSSHVKSVMAFGQSIAVLFDPPYELTKARPGAIQQRIKRVSALLDIPTLLPGIDLSDHLYVKEFAEHQLQLQDRLGKAKQESSDRIKATHRQFAALSGIIKEGKWGPANSMLRRLQKKLSVMEASERTSLNDKLTRAEQQLAEMADWQDFAARPKLEALCDSMEALPGKELVPEALAKQVRELQSEWKALGVSRASNELWSRFKTAGDTAYEPCKAWFDTKQKERQVKLDAKAALCDSLEQTHASLETEPDWKSIQRKVNNAKRDWSRNRVPDRKPDKALEARFSAALKPFEIALAEQYDANAQAKQALVEKVAALAEAEITQHSANQAKSLLSAWKLIGIMRRKEDQGLWEVFNGHLGTIFKHQHKVQREKQRAGLEHVFRAKDIIKRLKQLSKADTLEEAEVQALTTEFQALAEFPERDKKFLLRDFRQSVDSCSRVQENASRRRSQANQEERQRLLGLCEQLELAVEQSSALTDTLVDDVKHAWDASDARVAPDVMSVLLSRRDAALEHISAKTQPDYKVNEESRRELLIRMEVAAGVDTPAEDKSRRMQYQLMHLQEGMTSAGLDDAKQVLKKLELEWLSLGPASRAVSDSLHSRFLKAYRR
ncbi:MAG: DUF349 domain-containing protein [Granulosicoccus sp.]